MQPVLRILEQADGELRFQDLLDTIAGNLSIDPAEAERRLSSGRETALSNDLKWALSYLSIEGKVRLSPDGSRVFSLEASGLREAAPTYIPYDAATAATSPREAYPGADDDGSELARLFRQANKLLKRDLLGHVHAREPAFFEQLILDLLVAIGYARSNGQHKTRRLGGRSDGGVDGVIYQDELGLDFFYFQAKRYKPSTTVPLNDVRDFCGSLEAHKAPKGVFVTTAFLPKTAYSFVAAIPRRITLIDGDGLADLMIRHNIGVKSEPLYQLKEVDPVYFRL
jgi:restriction system protein